MLGSRENIDTFPADTANTSLEDDGGGKYTDFEDDGGGRYTSFEDAADTPAVENYIHFKDSSNLVLPQEDPTHFQVFVLMFWEAFKRIIEPDRLAEQTTETQDVFGSTPPRWFEVGCGVAYNYYQDGSPHGPDQTGNPKDCFYSKVYVNGDPDAGLTSFGWGLFYYAASTFFIGGIVGFYYDYCQVKLMSYKHLQQKLTELSPDLPESVSAMMWELAKAIAKEKIPNAKGYKLDSSTLTSRTLIKLRKEIKLDPLEGEFTPNHFFSLINYFRNLNAGDLLSKSWRVSYLNSMVMWSAWWLESLKVGMKNAFKPENIRWVGLPVVIWNACSAIYNLGSLLCNTYDESKALRVIYAPDYVSRELAQFYYNKKSHQDMRRKFAKACGLVADVKDARISQISNGSEVELSEVRDGEKDKQKEREKNGDSREAYRDDLEAQNKPENEIYEAEDKEKQWDERWKDIKLRRKWLEEKYEGIAEAEVSEAYVPPLPEEVYKSAIGKFLIEPDWKNWVYLAGTAFRVGFINGMVITAFCLVVGVTILLSALGTFTLKEAFVAALEMVVGWLISNTAAGWVGLSIGAVNGLAVAGQVRTDQLAHKKKVYEVLSAEYKGKGISNLAIITRREDLIEKQKKKIAALRKKIHTIRLESDDPREKEMKIAGFRWSNEMNLLIDYDLRKVDLRNLLYFAEQRHRWSFMDWVEWGIVRLYIALGGGETAAYIIRQIIFYDASGQGKDNGIANGLLGSIGLEPLEEFFLAAGAMFILGATVKTFQFQWRLDKEQRGFFVDTFASKPQYSRQTLEQLIFLKHEMKQKIEQVFPTEGKDKGKAQRWYNDRNNQSPVLFAPNKENVEARQKEVKVKQRRCIIS